MSSSNRLQLALLLYREELSTRNVRLKRYKAKIDLTGELIYNGIHNVRRHYSVSQFLDITREQRYKRKLIDLFEAICSKDQLIFIDPEIEPKFNKGYTFTGTRTTTATASEILTRERDRKNCTCNNNEVDDGYYGDDDDNYDDDQEMFSYQ